MSLKLIARNECKFSFRLRQKTRKFMKIDFNKFASEVLWQRRQHDAVREEKNETFFNALRPQMQFKVSRAPWAPSKTQVRLRKLKLDAKNENFLTLQSLNTNRNTSQRMIQTSARVIIVLWMLMVAWNCIFGINLFHFCMSEAGNWVLTTMRLDRLQLQIH